MTAIQKQFLTVGAIDLVKLSSDYKPRKKIKLDITECSIKSFLINQLKFKRDFRNLGSKFEQISIKISNVFQREGNLHKKL